MEKWHTYFTYDESTPSCLRGKPSIGNPKGLARGSFSEKSPYYRVKCANRMYAAHRVVWEMHNGAIPEKYEIDHFDGNIHNNRINNLRCVTKTINSKNKKHRIDNTTGHQGISLSTNNLGNQYYVFQWQTIEGVKKTKRFSCTRLGKTKALQDAIDFKLAMSQELILQGYTSRHHNAE